MSTSTRKIVSLLGAAALIVCLISAIPTAATARPFDTGTVIPGAKPQPLKVCSAYSREHFHGVTAHLPDGTQCLEPGEYCSHGPGYARAYREYGFRCESDGRLEEV